MSCEWGNTDCRNEGKRCDVCVARDFHYAPAMLKKPKPMAKRQARADKRQGSDFEFRNHQKNELLLSDASSRMTPNSGAGRIKGDEEIRGIIEIMEELKTKVKEQIPGKESFTLKREWLTKLTREAREAKKEFWYLKFSFHEYLHDTYIVVEESIIMSMVKTMVEDRKAVKQAEHKYNCAELLRRKVDADAVALQAENDYLKERIRGLEEQLKEDNF